MDKIITIIIQLLLWMSGKRTVAQQEGTLAAVWKGWRIKIGSISMGYQPPTEYHKAFWVIHSPTHRYFSVPRIITFGRPVIK